MRLLICTKFLMKPISVLSIVECYTIGELRRYKEPIPLFIGPDNCLEGVFLLSDIIKDYTIKHNYFHRPYLYFPEFRLAEHFEVIEECDI